MCWYLVGHNQIRIKFLEMDTSRIQSNQKSFVNLPTGTIHDLTTSDIPQVYLFHIAFNTENRGEISSALRMKCSRDHAVVVYDCAVAMWNLAAIGHTQTRCFICGSHRHNLNDPEKTMILTSTPIHIVNKLIFDIKLIQYQFNKNQYVSREMIQTFC